MQEWMIFVRDVGFPIVVTMYLLHRIETRLDQAIVMLSLIARQTEEAYPEKQVSCKAVTL